MALRQPYSINPYQGGQSSIGLNRHQAILKNRVRANEFKQVLSSLQGSFTKTSYKTRGLTIADYRVRPVISKSRRPSFSRPDLKHRTATNTNRFPERGPSAKIIKEPQSIHSPAAAPDREKVSASRPSGKTGQHQPFLADRQIIAQNVQKAAVKYNLPPELINGVIRAESNFKIRAVSAAGAQGLMQLMPATARELGVRNPFDIEQNINGGSKYLRQMLDRFGGDIRKALAAYNAGPGTVIKFNGRVPYAETRQYVKRVLRFSSQTI